MQIFEGGVKTSCKIWLRRRLCQPQGYISGILFADSCGTTSFEKNLKIEKSLDKCFEAPHYFFEFAREEAEKKIVECFSPMNSGGRINLIQFDITDKCNLNCALCSHFSPLVKEENKYSVQQFAKDVCRPQELTEHIENIGLWGGETLLHPQLDEIINIVRKAFPNSELEVGTNGILLPSISDKVLDAVRENDCTFRISGYPPTMKILDKIEERLRNKGIKYSVAPVELFSKGMSYREIIMRQKDMRDVVPRFAMLSKMVHSPPAIFHMARRFSTNILRKNLMLIKAFLICMIRT